MRVLVTGATGFVGQVVVGVLADAGVQVRAAVRQGRDARPLPAEVSETIAVPDIGPDTNWRAALADVDAVIHLAARAHVMRDNAPDPLVAFNRVNYAGTKRLADACAGRVKRLVFLSSIGVHGQVCHGGIIDESTEISPKTPYARSKHAAERYLCALSDAGWLDSVILRPPLVFGVHAPGNLATLIAGVRRGLPLPLGSVGNRRSLIGVDHLAGAILAVLEAEHAASTVYVVADREIVSTPDIIRAIADGVGRPPRLPAVPVGLLRAAGALTGHQSMIEQLTGNLEVNGVAFRRDFGDRQPFTTLEGLRMAARSSRRT